MVVTSILIEFIGTEGKARSNNITKITESVDINVGWEPTYSMSCNNDCDSAESHILDPLWMYVPHPSKWRQCCDFSSFFFFFFLGYFGLACIYLSWSYCPSLSFRCVDTFTFFSHFSSGSCSRFDIVYWHFFVFTAAVMCLHVFPKSSTKVRFWKWLRQLWVLQIWEWASKDVVISSSCGQAFCFPAVMKPFFSSYTQFPFGLICGPRLRQIQLILRASA